MPWYIIDSVVTLPFLYAIIGSMIEFRFSKKRSLILIGLTICATILMDTFSYLHGGVTDLYANAWITTCIPSFLCLLYLAKNRDGSFLFIFLTEAVLAVIVTFLASIFAFLLPWQSGVFRFMFHTIMLMGIFFVSRYLLGSKFIEAAKDQGKRWPLYCTLPVMCIVLWIMYTSSSSHLIDTANKIYLPYAGFIYPYDIPVFIVLLVIVFYMVSLILMIITITHHADKDKREKEALYFQSRALKERLLGLEDKDESLRIIRHDMRHHLRTLSGLLYNEEILGAQEYIKQLDLNLLQVKQKSFCANTVINAIVSYHAAIAKKEKIHFSIKVQLSNKLPVDDMDIGAVLSNALENAQNACLKQPPNTTRFIELKFIQHKKQFVLDISNSFDRPIVFNISGCPVSQSKDHGLGSQSIFAFVRKYNSTIDYSAKNGVFNVRIMFTDSE